MIHQMNLYLLWQKQDEIIVLKIVYDYIRLNISVNVTIKVCIVEKFLYKIFLYYVKCKMLILYFVDNIRCINNITGPS